MDLEITSPNLRSANPMNIPLPFDADEVERRKQLFRDLWAGQPLDHVPVLINVVNPTPRYPVRAQFLEAD